VVFPPHPRDPLMRGPKEIPARPRREVARDRGLDVDGLSHACTISRTGPPGKGRIHHGDTEARRTTGQGERQRRSPQRAQRTAGTGGRRTAFTAKDAKSAECAKEGTRSQKRSAWTADGLPWFMRRSADASRSTLSRRSGVHRPTSRFQSSSLVISTNSPSGWTYVTPVLGGCRSLALLRSEPAVPAETEASQVREVANAHTVHQLSPPST
jgi:hypothetical protein